MDKLNDFFKTLAKTPSLLYKFSMSVLFVSISIGVLFMKSLDSNGSSTTRYGLAAALFVYSIFRFAGFYAEYKSVNK